MARFLLDRSTGQLLPYPRQDNEPVAGLDRDAAYVVEVVREPEPEEYDPTTHYLQPLEPVIWISDPDSTDLNGTATYRWELVPIPEPAPAPRWVEFGGAIQASQQINTLLGAALQQLPALGLGLSVGLGKAADGDARVFLNSWGLAVSLGLITAELLAEVTALAEACDLPANFMAALLPE